MEGWTDGRLAESSNVFDLKYPLQAECHAPQTSLSLKGIRSKKTPTFCVLKIDSYLPGKSKRVS